MPKAKLSSFPLNHFANAVVTATQTETSDIRVSEIVGKDEDDVRFLRRGGLERGAKDGGGREQGRRVDAQAIGDLRALSEALKTFVPGQVIEVKFLRDGKPQAVPMKLGER